LLKTSIYIQIVIRWASIHRLSICIIDLPTTAEKYGKTLRHKECDSCENKLEKFWKGKREAVD
jgi:hypothetical protein